MFFIYLSEIVILVKKCSNGLNGFDQVKGQMFSNYNSYARLSVCAKVWYIRNLSEKLIFSYLWKICVRDIIFNILSKLYCKQ